jgi:hypothetical protein
VVPADDPRFWQLELFVYLVDVPPELGPPGLVPRTQTTGLPAKPNWYPRAGGADPEGGWVETTGSPGLYDAEVPAAGPAGTVVAWAPGTFHRGTALTLRLGGERAPGELDGPRPGTAGPLSFTARHAATPAPGPAGRR